MPTIRRHLLAWVAVLLVAAAGSGSAPAVRPGSLRAQESAARIAADVAWLADDAREGRAPGSAGYDSASVWVATRYRSLAIGGAPGRTSYHQHFRAAGQFGPGRSKDTVATRNVIAALEGLDPALRHEVIVVGAHLDHLGMSPLRSLDPGRGDAIRNGADDNASGTAAVLELARRFESSPTLRTIVFAHFGAEEAGMIGSQAFLEDSIVPIASIRFMLNLDMVGRLGDRRIGVRGTRSAPGLASLIDSVAGALRTAIDESAAVAMDSDHAPFHLKGVPVLHLTSGMHRDYHRATDDVQHIDAAGIVRIVDLAEALVRALADRPGVPLSKPSN